MDSEAWMDGMNGKRSFLSLLLFTSPNAMSKSKSIYYMIYIYIYVSELIVMQFIMFSIPGPCFCKWLHMTPSLRPENSVFLGKKNNLQHGFPGYWRFHLFPGIPGWAGRSNLGKDFGPQRSRLSTFTELH